MKPSSFIRVMSLCSMIFGSIFLFTLIFTNPEKGIYAKTSFLLTLFVFIFSVSSLLLFLVKKKAANNEIVHLYVKSSTRQGLLLGLFVVGSLLLAIIDLFTWWDGILLAFSLILIELYFKSGKVVH